MKEIQEIESTKHKQTQLHNLRYGIKDYKNDV